MNYLPIRLITQRDLIRTITNRWRAHYSIRDLPEDILLKLEALEKLDLNTAAASAVDAITGDKRWTTIHCDCCERDVASAISFYVQQRGEEFDICPVCLGVAMSRASLEASPLDPPQGAKDPEMCGRQAWYDRKPVTANPFNPAASTVEAGYHEEWKRGWQAVDDGVRNYLYGNRATRPDDSNPPPGVGGLEVQHPPGNRP